MAVLGVKAPPALDSFAAILFAVIEPFGQTLRKPGRTNLLLGGFLVVFQSTQFDRAFIHVINDIRRTPVAIARLANAADIDEVLLALINLEF